MNIVDILYVWLKKDNKDLEGNSELAKSATLYKAIEIEEENDG